jgi:hypothetical protein
MTPVKENCVSVYKHLEAVNYCDQLWRLACEYRKQEDCKSTQRTLNWGVRRGIAKDMLISHVQVLIAVRSNILSIYSDKPESAYVLM